MKLKMEGGWVIYVPLLTMETSLVNRNNTTSWKPCPLRFFRCLGPQDRTVQQLCPTQMAQSSSEVPPTIRATWKLSAKNLTSATDDRQTSMALIGLSSLLDTY